MKWRVEYSGGADAERQLKNILLGEHNPGEDGGPKMSQAKSFCEEVFCEETRPKRML
jgi:hypothetical protein